MRSREAGRVNHRIWYLGREESGVYLVEGREGSMILNGGMSYIVPDVLGQMAEFGIDEGTIRWLTVLHAHFDHVGVVPFFKRRLPEVKVLASARAWELLESPKVVDTVNSFSAVVAQRMGRAPACAGLDLAWRDDVRGAAVGEGDEISLGDLTVRFLETPGHSSCSISAYVPELRALFPSDGGGIPYRDTIITSGNSDYTQFQRSLERLAGLPVDYYCADHYGFVTGEEAGAFARRAADVAAKWRGFMEGVYRRTRDVDESARKLTAAFYHENPDYILSPEIFEGVFRQMVRHIARGLEA